MEMLREAAEQGVPQAQCDYALAIQATNPAQADTMLRSALDKNSSVAQLWFARILLEAGKHKNGMSLLRRAANQGNADAQFEIGKRAVTLTGDAKEEALTCLRTAANSGHLAALYTLGQYMVANRDNGGLAVIRDALARGYVAPVSDSKTPP
jgi:TPR repeat protein